MITLITQRRRMLVLRHSNRTNNNRQYLINNLQIMDIRILQRYRYKLASRLRITHAVRNRTSNSKFTHLRLHLISNKTSNRLPRNAQRTIKAHQRQIRLSKCPQNGGITIRLNMYYSTIRRHLRKISIPVPLRSNTLRNSQQSIRYTHRLKMRRVLTPRRYTMLLTISVLCNRTLLLQRQSLLNIRPHRVKRLAERHYRIRLKMSLVYRRCKLLLMSILLINYSASRRIVTLHRKHDDRIIVTIRA